MKITKIEPVVVGAPTPGTGQLSNKNYLFVRVHTDEGITVAVGIHYVIGRKNAAGG